jgi:hypothetical protein
MSDTADDGITLDFVRRAAEETIDRENAKIDRLREILPPPKALAEAALSRDVDEVLALTIQAQTLLDDLSPVGRELYGMTGGEAFDETRKNVDLWVGIFRKVQRARN